jgi:tRNA modification GTPase
MDELEERLYALCLAPGTEPAPEVWITQIRHKQALEDVGACLRQAREALLASRSPELPAEDLRLALDRLGEIDGRTIGDDVLDSIFSRFCIGK